MNDSSNSHEIAPRQRTDVARLNSSIAIVSKLLAPSDPSKTSEALQEAIEARLEAAGLAEVPAGMVLIPAGDFVMGDTFGEGYSVELPLHTVTVSAFYMGETEVTKTQWDAVHGWAVTNGYAFENTGSGKAGNHPVHTVNWYDCVKWANARSEMEGLSPCYLAETTTGTVYRAGALAPTVDRYASGYRLPTEAEWEKAARGGAPGTRFPWTGVNTIQHTRANYWADAGGYEYDTSAQDGFHPDYDDDPEPYTSPVGTFAPNGYGLYDMGGNVWEWCEDVYVDSYEGAPTDGSAQTSGGSKRVHRGGGWKSSARNVRSAGRLGHLPSSPYRNLGFRVCLGRSR
jgi:formylglycine-generating enzyme required for sulfatase activity